MEKILDQIFSERGYTEKRPHQYRNILDYTNPKKPHVVAIATSGGKTIMTAAKLELYYKTGIIGKNDKVLIIPSDKTILRGNFIKQFNDFFSKKKASFTWEGVEDKRELAEVIKNKTQVIIALPQLIKDNTKLIKKVKWLVVDEAHKWYFASTIRNIIRDLKPDHQFLLTGTPFKFNLNKDNFIIDYTSVSTLYNQGFIGDVNLQVLHTSVALSRLDWVSMTDNLRASKRFGKKELTDAFGEVVDQLIKKLKVPVKDLSSAHNVTGNMLSLFGKLQKTIVFTHGINEANCLHEYLKSYGVNALVSHSEDDQVAEDTFNNFKEQEDIKVLVSVNRGKEGFDFPELYNIIDMTYSQNFEVVMQMIGRLLRKSKNKTYKVFYKVAPKNTAGYFTDWMDCLIQLFDDYWYSKFNGRNTLDIRVPYVLIDRKKEPKDPQYIQDGKTKIQIVSGTSFGVGGKVNIVDKDNVKKPVKDGDYTVPVQPTAQNPKPDPIKITVKGGKIVKTTATTSRGRINPKNLQAMGFDNSLSFMEKNDWFRLEDPLSTVATTSLYRIIIKFFDDKRSRTNKSSALTIEDAKLYVHSLGIKSIKEWNNYVKKESLPHGIPKSPDDVYKNDGWLGWNDFLNIQEKEMLSFEECKAYARSLNFTGARQWREHLKPDNVPSKPYDVYEEWTNWGDFLGTGTIASYNVQYRNVEDAKNFVHKLKLKNRDEWSDYCKSGKKPNDIPNAFWNVYKISTGEFLGNGAIATNDRIYKPYDDAQKVVSKMGFKNNKEYKRAYEKGLIPSDIPKTADRSYSKKGTWKGWPDFLGHGKYKTK